MRRNGMRALVALGILVAPMAFADEAAVRLKEGAGKGLVEENCALCHSLDYIPMNSVFLDRKGWEGSVAKMIKFGAPVTPEEAGKIVDYLTENYAKR